MAQEVFDQTEAAAFIGASRNLVRKALLSGELPARRIGRRWFIGRAALEAWLAGEQPPLTRPADAPAVALERQP